MSGMSQNQVKISYESKQMYSSNFIVDRIIKQKLYDLEKVINIQAKSVMKAEEENDVILDFILHYYKKRLIYFKKFTLTCTVNGIIDEKEKEKKQVTRKFNFNLIQRF